MSDIRNTFVQYAIKEVGMQGGTKYIMETWGENANYAWCATFISWCAKKAGINQSTIIYSRSAEEFYNFFNNKKSIKYRSTYNPMCGDIILYYFNKPNRRCTHVGICVGTDDKFVYAIDGNWSKQVSSKKISKSDNSIIGYGVWTNANTVANYTNVKGTKQVSPIYRGGRTVLPSAYQRQSYGQYQESIPHDTYSGNYGLLQGGSVYYNLKPLEENVDVPTIYEVITDEHGNETEVEVTGLTTLNADSSPIDCDDNPEEDAQKFIEENKKIIEAGIKKLTPETVEKIQGIEYNADGSYVAKEVPDEMEILKKAESLVRMTDILSMGFEKPNKVIFTSDTLASAITSDAGIPTFSNGTGQLQTVMNIKAAVDKYGQAIRNGMNCSVCGKNIPYMPVQGFCSIQCFTQDLTTRIMTHMKRDEDSPITEILKRVGNVLDFFSLVLNVLLELPELLRNLKLLPDVWRNYLMLYVNIIFVKLRIIINKLMIKKNEYIIYVLKYMQRGLNKPFMQTLFAPIEAVLMAVDKLKMAFETAYSAAMKALETPGMGIEPESYAWLFTPRSMMNGDAMGQYIINLPKGGLKLKLIPTMANIAMPQIDEFVKKTFPPIQSVEYFMDPALFDVRLALSDQSDVVKKFMETLELFLVFGLDYLPRWKRLSIINPFFVLAILDGWGPHGRMEYGSIIYPQI